jgi:hypothetical protein
VSAPLAFLDGLAAVVAEAEMDGARTGEGIEHAINRLGGNGTVGWIAGDIRFVDLQATARKPGDLLRENIGDGHQQILEAAVMPVEQRARQHVGTGDGELERAVGNTGRQFAIGHQVERAFAQRGFDHAGGFVAETHRAHASERFMIAAAHLGAHAGHGADEVLDHAVGVRMVHVKAVQFAVGGQVDGGLALNIEDHARGVEASLFAGQRDEPVGSGVGANGGG